MDRRLRVLDEFRESMKQQQLQEIRDNEYRKVNPVKPFIYFHRNSKWIKRKWKK
jgi:hypothetical protein